MLWLKLLVAYLAATLVGVAVLATLIRYDRKPYGQHEDMP